MIALSEESEQSEQSDVFEDGTEDEQNKRVHDPAENFLLKIFIILATIGAVIWGIVTFFPGEEGETGPQADAMRSCVQASEMISRDQQTEPVIRAESMLESVGEGNTRIISDYTCVLTRTESGSYSAHIEDFRTR